MRVNAGGFFTFLGVLVLVGIVLGAVCAMYWHSEWIQKKFPPARIALHHLENWGMHDNIKVVQIDKEERDEALRAENIDKGVKQSWHKLRVAVYKPGDDPAKAQSSAAEVKLRPFGSNTPSNPVTATAGNAAHFGEMVAGLGYDVICTLPATLPGAEQTHVVTFVQPRGTYLLRVQMPKL